MKAFLVIVVLNGAGWGERYSYFAQPTMEECEARVKAMAVHITTGGDAEQGIAAFCSATKREVQQQ